MPAERLTDIVIVGGGTAGWMTAAALSRVLDTARCRVRLIESAQIGTVGVGEATIPAIHDYLRRFGIDEREMMRRTHATYKLGIEFANWGQVGDVYMHPFSTFGRDMNGVAFHHYWLRQRLAGDNSPIDEYSLAHAAAEAKRFDYPQDDSQTVYSTYSYAFHFDASRFALYLREFAEQRGVRRIEGKVVDVTLRGSGGHIESVTLENGEKIAGEFYIDCSGFRGLLIEGALATGYEDWRRWLPCDRAMAVASARDPEPPPKTRAIAHGAGWQWRIPLQHRTGNGYVYSSEHLDDNAARDTLLRNLDGVAESEPRVLAFVPGMRRRMWNRNCVAIGLSGGFLEPLESTSIHLIQEAIVKLIEFFPDRSFAPPDRDEFNRQMAVKFTRIRNFIILHYKATRRNDTAFWKYCRDMPIPDELAARIDLFRTRGLAVHEPGELFIEANWLAVYLGQGVIPCATDPRASCLPGDTVRQRLAAMKTTIRRAAQALPTHASSIERYCAAAAGGQAT